MGHKFGDFNGNGKFDVMDYAIWDALQGDGSPSDNSGCGCSTVLWMLLFAAIIIKIIDWIA